MNATTNAQINNETNAEFWAKTAYKPNQKLNPADSQDAKMIPMWNAIHARIVDAFNKYGKVLPVSLVDKETDARFWAASGYKPGQPLNAADPLDRPWIDAWNAIWADTAHDVATGKIIWTYDLPVVADPIVKAQEHHEAAKQSLANAKTAHDAGDRAAAQKHTEDAHAAIGAAQIATAQAAVHQPPIPPAAHAAAKQAAQAAHEVLTFQMNGAGQGVLTGVTGGPAPAPVAISPEDQVAIVQSSLGPTRTAPAAEYANAEGGTMPGGKNHNALIIGGICLALAGGVAIANLTQKRIAIRRAR